MSQSGDNLAQVVKLASDYGPFLFAILFILVVPRVAYRNLHDALTKFPQPTTSQSGLIRQSQIYFLSTWIAGFVLTAASVGWWLYLNSSRLSIETGKYWITYEGDIYGVGEDDLLEGEDGKLESAISSRIFMWTSDKPNFHYRFLLLNDAPVSPEHKFSVLWFSKQQAHHPAGTGPLSVPFLLDPGKTVYQLRREGTRSIVANDVVANN